jgi:inhibitor of nuclear factor kappa-B kinase subunit alpha
MGKISLEDKMRIQTLYEQGIRGKAIIAAYPTKGWKLCSVEAICRRVRDRGSAILRKAGSGRPKSARCTEKIQQVAELICSQEGRPGSRKSTRQIAKAVRVSATSVRRIAKRDLGLVCFKRTPVQVITEGTTQKRLGRCKALLKRLTLQKTKRVFFTDEKVFYLSPPVNTQNNRVWSTGKKGEIESERLLVQRAKFSARVMVSAGVCFNGKGRLHFVPEKAKINAAYYTDHLLPLLVQDCNNLLGNDFVFQQDGAPAHSSHQAQDWLELHCSDFLRKDEWPPNSPDLNPLDFHVWGAMLTEYDKLQSKPETITELRAVLQKIWDKLPQDSIGKTVLSFRKRLQACVRANGGHFEHVLT